MIQDIHMTSDYTIFKKHPNNRAIDAGALKKLIASIQMNNLLEFRPINVDTEMRVIDGQHRLEAAKFLKLPIYYQISSSLKAEDMVILNSNQKTWQYNDYLNFYCQQGKEEYIKLKRFMEKNKYTFSRAINFLHGYKKHDLTNKIKSGLYKFPNEDEMIEVMEKQDNVQKIVDYINKKTPTNKKVANSLLFVNALIEFLNNKGVDFDEFFKKFQYRLDFLRPCSRKVDYLMIFKDIYNWRNRNPIGVGKADEDTPHGEKHHHNLFRPIKLKARDMSLFDR